MDRTTMLIGAALLIVCVVCLTTLTALKIIPPDAVTHMAATIVGGILMYATPGKSLVSGLTSVVPGIGSAK
jgi:hypothetical protein